MAVATVTITLFNKYADVAVAQARVQMAPIQPDLDALEAEGATLTDDQTLADVDGNIVRTLSFALDAAYTEFYPTPDLQGARLVPLGGTVATYCGASQETQVVVA